MELTETAGARTPDEIVTPPSKGVICAVIVTHHPDGGLFSRAERAALQVGRVVVVDNGSEDSSVRDLRRLSERLQAKLILNCRNQGVASALNQGVRWAADQGYSWVLTLDQDSVAAPRMVDSLIEAFPSHACPQKLAVIGVNYRNSSNGRSLLERNERTDSPWKEVKTAITSGSLISVRAFHAIGGFRDEFFIDSVDLEYCLRARTQGFLVILARKALMEHSIGRVSGHRFLWKKTGTSNHPAFRHYFMARNTLILARDYIRKEPAWVLATLWDRAKSVVLMCLFEEARILKIRQFALGCLDGVRGKFDRFS